MPAVMSFVIDLSRIKQTNKKCSLHLLRWQMAVHFV